MNLESLAALLILLLAGWLWLATLQARERALWYAQRACERGGLQLLDQTVMLRGVRPLWTPEGVRLRRTYHFEYSAEGVERRAGVIVLLGLRLEHMHLEQTESEREQREGPARGDAGAPAPTEPDGGPNGASGRFDA